MNPTPGPWTADPEGSLTDGIGIRVNGRRVANAVLPHSGDFDADCDTARANARLIAASPRLADTLRAIADRAHRCANGGLTRAGGRVTVGMLRAELREIREAARAAIAKAEKGE